MMLAAIIYQLIPPSEGSFQLLISQWWLAPILFITSLILFWRHTTLAYGDMKFIHGWEVITAVALLIATPYAFGVSVGNNSLIQLILIIFMMDRLVNSLSVRRSPFFVFDIGILLGLLSMIHPAYLLLIPYFLFKFHQLEISSLAHTLSQLLGVTTVWLLFIFLFTEPNLSSIGQGLYTKIAPLLSPSLPTLTDVPLLIAIIVFLISTMIIFYHGYIRSIRRVRFLYLSHLKFSWLLLPIFFIYGNFSTPSLVALVPMILFFASSPALYLCANPSKSKYQDSIFFCLALLFSGVVFWSASPNVHLFTLGN